MALVDVVMPQMGESIAEGTITKWYKKVGDKIAKDETLLEISTDKVDSEIPSPVAGIIAELLFPEQKTVAVHTVIAKVQTDASAAVSTPTQQPAKKEEAPKEEIKPVETPKQTPVVSQSITEPQSDKFYSPLVMNIARTEGVSMNELETIQGTGASNRVTKKDILEYVEKKKGGKVSTQNYSMTYPIEQRKPLPTVVPSGRVEIIKMDTMRKAIAEHMVRSIHTSAHVGSVTEADVTKIVAYREKHKNAFEKREGYKLTFTPFFIDAAVKALKDFPMLNASVEGENIILRKDINVGVAVALDNNGLIVPVIKGADSKNLVGFAQSMNDLANRARIKKLLPDEVAGGTFTITNPGNVGNLYGFPIINQPQVAILGIGAIQKRPVVIDDAIAIRSMVYLSMSYDHRVIDGMLGGMYLERVAEYLEKFDVNQSI